MSAAYYNENDPFAVTWLRSLIEKGHIAPGVVDQRSIVDVQASDLEPFTQCHFFAGVGVWSYALRRAGWSDDRPVWSGSCPCQPFSKAGGLNGATDGRHLWPAFFRLIRERAPRVVFGEQVAGEAGFSWFDHVSADLESCAYATAAADMCAAGVGAPHIRQRLFWLAHTASARRQRGHVDGLGAGPQLAPAQRDREAFGLADATRARLGSIGRRGLDRVGQARLDADGDHETHGAGPTSGEWSPCDWLLCRDARWRPVEPESFPLAARSPSRVGRLRAYGNALVAPLAQAFVEASLDVIEEIEHLEENSK